MEPKFGSYFGTCTCGTDKVDAIACNHMAAIALSLRLHPHNTHEFNAILVAEGALVKAVTSRDVLCRMVNDDEND